MKYKIKPHDEVNDVYLLYKQVWWIFYSFVGAGKREKLKQHIETNNGTLVK
jgi:hypothetical protein